MFCTACGTPNPVTARFCQFCGKQHYQSPTAEVSHSSLQTTSEYANAYSTSLPYGAAFSATSVPPVSGASRFRAFTVVAYLVMLWGLAIPPIAFANNSLGVAPLSGAALFGAYGMSLLRRHRSAVWLGWFLCGVTGVGVAVGGFVPLAVLLWLMVTGWAAYAHSTLRSAQLTETASTSPPNSPRRQSRVSGLRVVNILTGAVALAVFVGLTLWMTGGQSGTSSTGDDSGATLPPGQRRTLTTLICAAPSDSGLTGTPWVLRIDATLGAVEMVVQPRSTPTIEGIEKGNRLGRVAASERAYSILIPADTDPLGAMQFAFEIDRFTGVGKLEIGEPKYGDTATFEVRCIAGSASPKL